jgi:hypothetical protein
MGHKHGILIQLDQDRVKHATLRVHERRKIVRLAGTPFTHITKLYRSCTIITVVVNTNYI